MTRMLPSGLPETVFPEEELARFLTQKSHYSSNGVKPGAFLPSPKDQATSVSRHGHEPADTLKQLGLAAAGNRSLYGAAILKCHEVNNAGLDVSADEPPELHALIQRWPWLANDPQLQKAQQKELALQLARASVVALFK